MTAIRASLSVEAGSFEPRYWLVTSPTTGLPIDLTVTGYSVSGVVVDVNGTVLLELPDDTIFRRTSDGRVYFEPPSVVTAAWPGMWGDYQIKLSHPSGETVRLSQGSFSVDPEFISP